MKKHISKEDILIFMNENRLTVDFYEIIWTYKSLANNLETSVYQIKKRFKELKAINAVYYGSMSFGCRGSYEYGCDCDNHLPIWGWRLNKDFIKNEMDKASKAIEEFFKTE